MKWFIVYSFFFADLQNNFSPNFVESIPRRIQAYEGESFKFACSANGR